MTGWHIAHIIVLSGWAGLVAAEGVMELVARRSADLAVPVARLHYYLDVVVEAPLLLGVILTGSILLLRLEPDAALWVKVAAGLGAITSNVVCVAVVIRRHAVATRDADVGALARLSTWVQRTAFTGLPLALYLGGHRAGWW